MKDFDELVEILAALRGEGGCEWDRKQTFETMKPHLLEEMYELFDALEREDKKEMKEELGDLLMHMVFLSRMAQEKGWFDVQGVLKEINAKLIRRHPHVFGDQRVEGVADILKNWEEIKKQEKKEERESILDGIPQALPAMQRAYKIQGKLSRVGFEWQEDEGIWSKLHEELDELKVELKAGDKEKALGEMGDVLFVLIHLAMKSGLDPESALEKTNKKVISRIKFMEKALGKGKGDLKNLSLEELDSLWQQAKKAES